jgi:ABC-type glycerol-3-phosphate transport system substrate-binding protein
MVFWPEWAGKDADALQAGVKIFTDQTGIAVDFLPIRDHARMIAAISAGTPPDLLMTWDAGAVGSWGFAGALRDLTPMIQAAKFDMTTLHPLGISSGNLMGVKQIGLPLSNYITTVFWWNKANFKAAGLDPEKPPTTWEEVWEFNDKLTVLNGTQITKLGYLVLTGQDSEPTVMPYAYGGSIWSDDYKKITPDSDASIASLTWMRQFYAKYTTDEVRRWTSSNSADETSPTHPIFNGSGAMYVNGEWVPSFVDALPDLHINLGGSYLPHPAAHPEVKNIMVANTNPLVIPTAATNPDAAFKLTLHLLKPDISSDILVKVGNASPTKEGLKLQATKTTNVLYKWILEDPWINGDIKPMTINSPIGSEYHDAYVASRAQVVEDGNDPAQVMAKLKADMQPKLDDALKKLNL